MDTRVQACPDWCKCLSIWIPGYRPFQIGAKDIYGLNGQYGAVNSAMSWTIEFRPFYIGKFFNDVHINDESAVAT